MTFLEASEPFNTTLSSPIRHIARLAEGCLQEARICQGATVSGKAIWDFQGLCGGSLAEMYREIETARSIL